MSTDFWRSDEGKALLWKAYPDGYLAVRGVLTVGDDVGSWTCLGGPDVHGMTAWASSTAPAGGDLAWSAPVGFRVGKRPLFAEDCELPTPELAARLNRALLRGDFLPLPDPSDAATWACLLADLAIACGMDVANAIGFTWAACYRGGWALSVYTARSGMLWRFAAKPFPLPSLAETIAPEVEAEHDPARALVLARIHVRETTGR